MKIFFDTNIYVAEALLGSAAEQMVVATAKAKWRIFVSEYLLGEIERVLTDHLGFSRRFGYLTRLRCHRRAVPVRDVPSRQAVPNDPDDNPILRAAVKANVDYLVTNDAHLLELNRYQSIRIISMTDYYQLMVDRGLLDV